MNDNNQQEALLLTDLQPQLGEVHKDLFEDHPEPTDELTLTVTLPLDEKRHLEEKHH